MINQNTKEYGHLVIFLMHGSYTEIDVVYLSIAKYKLLTKGIIGVWA